MSLIVFKEFWKIYIILVLAMLFTRFTEANVHYLQLFVIALKLFNPAAATTV